MEQTITFTDSGNKWNGFFSYFPDMMIGMNNVFYSFKNGDLYQHDLGPRNTFYGQYGNLEIEGVVNEQPSDDKMFNNVVLESTEPFDVELETNLNASTIDANEFVIRESNWFAHTRRDESAVDLKGLSTAGIGVPTGAVANVISFNSVSEKVSTGDKLYQVNGTTYQEVGTITEHDATSITVASYVNTLINGAFCFASKDSRLEGSKMRGYFLKFKLVNNSTEEVEIYAFNTLLGKSHV